MGNLTKANQKQFAAALRAHPHIPGYFARSVSAMHRAANERQQAAIWEAIKAAKLVTEFEFLPNGSMVARAS